MTLRHLCQLLCKYLSVCRWATQLHCSPLPVSCLWAGGRSSCGRPSETRWAEGDSWRWVPSARRDQTAFWGSSEIQVTLKHRFDCVGPLICGFFFNKYSCSFYPWLGVRRCIHWPSSFYIGELEYPWILVSMGGHGTTAPWIPRDSKFWGSKMFYADFRLHRGQHP